MSYSIRSYFAAKSVLVTGFTGFLGKVLVEKLLRDLPELGKLYILIRPQPSANGSRKEPEQRMYDELNKNPVFERLRRDRGSGFESFCAARIVCVPGDLTVERLGLDQNDYTALADGLDVIIGSAATVSFDERLDVALAVNAEGPRRLLELARAARSSYVHISTAFVSGTRRGLICEDVLEPMQAIREQNGPNAKVPDHFDVTEEIARLADTCRKLLAGERPVKHDMRESAARVATRKKLVAAGMRRARELGWNDTYTYTKFLGEHVVRLHQGDVPTLIVRPSIINSSLREPAPGWIEGLRVTDPLIISFGKGWLNSFPTRREAIIDLIPVDFVVNAILAGAAALETNPDACKVMHVASSTVNPIHIGELYEATREYFVENPFYDARGRPVVPPVWNFPKLDRFRRDTALLRRGLQLTEALASVGSPFPWGRRALRRQRRRRNHLERLINYVNLYGAYANLDCRFDAANALQLSLRLPEDERSCFNFDPSSIDWVSYIQKIHIPGLRRNVLRDGAQVPRKSGPKAGTATTQAERGVHGRSDNLVAKRVLNTSGPPRELEQALEPSLVRTLLAGTAFVTIKAILHTWIQLECEGREHVPKSGPYILVSNHTSHLDTAVLRDALGSLASGLYVMAAKDYFFDSPIKAWFVSAAFNTLPFERNKGTLLSLSLCRRVLDKRRALLIYPEGGRSKTGTLQPFKPGIGILALELGHPVIPVHVRGTFESLPPGAMIPRPARVRVRFGAPLYPGDLLAPPMSVEPADACRKGRRADRHRYRLASERIRAAVAGLEALP